jgi:hypothetical protein
MRGPAWAVIPVASIVGVIFAIRYASGTATWLTYLALVAVPILAAVALGGFMRGGRVWFALLVVPLFLLTWQTPHSLVGEGSGAILCGLSCVTLGVLLGAVTPSLWLKLGILAMALADVWLVFSNLLQNPNGTLIAAAPGGGLPQLQSVMFGQVTLGYGDLFVAGLLGALLSARGGVQRSAALLTLGLAAVFDLLFLVHKIYYQTGLPATVPVALALIVLEGYWWRKRRGGFSGRPGRSKPVAVTPPPVT